MRSFIIATAALSALVSANSEANAFNNPPGGYVFTAGKPTTLTWKPDTTGSISLRLQSGSVSTPDSGDVIASSIGNSGSYTWHVPSNLVAHQKYSIEIIDDSDSNEYNFSPSFTVVGADGSASATSSSAASTSEATTTTSEKSTTSTSASSTESSTSAATTSTSASSTSASSSSATTLTTASSTSATPSSSSSSTPTADSSSSASPSGSSTSVPNTNGAASKGVSGSMVAAIAGLLAFL